MTFQDTDGVTAAENPAAELAAARRLVERHARSAEDQRLLLAALGLTTTDTIEGPK
ncbi:hypothetical protein [Streptomyces sp. NPDC058045]|uniref:hypothetical protein n=1 Tax=Streptomyces sp. NPDC058045 TaxID=3346311 RepID=UPI0036E6AB71